MDVSTIVSSASHLLPLCHYSAGCPPPSLSLLSSSCIEGLETRRPPSLSLSLSLPVKVEISAGGSSRQLKLIAGFSPALAIMAPLL